MAQLSQLKSELALAKQRLDRLTLLADTVPKKEIQATQAQLHSLGEQVSAVSGGIGSREELRSLSNGVVASTAAIAGKVFSEGDVLFEIVNPKVVRIVLFAILKLNAPLPENFFNVKAKIRDNLHSIIIF